jgi:tripartite-type tricarboxylate transporter receptor subunit TctC
MGKSHSQGMRRGGNLWLHNHSWEASMKASVRKAATPRHRAAPRPNERLVTQHARRRILSLAAGAAVLPAMSRMAWGQAYPTRSVRIIVGAAPGGSQDIVARIIGQWLSERFGRQFIIENRTGGGNNVATEAVVKAPPDGHTLLLVGDVHAINDTLYEHLNFKFLRDISPVASLVSVPLFMIVHPSFPARSVPEFIAYAKANPGKINFGSSVLGSMLRMAGEMFKMMAGVDMTIVPYRGTAPMLTDLLGGQLQVTIADLPGSIEYIRTGSLRALAVTTAERSPALPAIPTIGDFLPGFEASAWLGIGVPKSTSAVIIEKLNKEINAGLANPVIKARLGDLGFSIFSGSPVEFGKHIANETEKWGKVIRAANIKAE